MSVSLDDVPLISVSLESVKKSYDFGPLLIGYEHLDANTWKDGDPLPGGRQRQESGFSAAIVEAATVEEVQSNVTEFLRENEDLIFKLNSANAQTSISILLGVGGSVYARILKLGPDFLIDLGDKNLYLRIVACFTAD